MNILMRGRDRERKSELTIMGTIPNGVEYFKELVMVMVVVCM